MSKEDQDIGAEDYVRLSEFVERFEPGFVEVDGTSVVRLPREAFGIHAGLWRHVIDDRSAPELSGRAVREAVAVVYEEGGEFLGVVLTPVGALVAASLGELNDQIRVFAAGEWTLQLEDIQVTTRLVQEPGVEASLVKELFGV